MLTVTADDHDGWRVIRAIGEIDLVTAADVRLRVHQAVAEGFHEIVLDLSGVRFCDSSGIGALVAARRLIRSCAGELRLVLPAAGEHVNRVFAALGVRRLFDIFPDVASAVRTPRGGAEGSVSLPA